MNRKRFFSIILMAFMFLTVNFIGPDMTRLIRGEKSYTVALAAGPRSSSGGFKSGSFKSSGGFKSGGFKSGSFFSSKKSGSSWSGSSSWSTRSSRRSWIPIPIPWHFGGYHGFGFVGFLFGSIWAIIRLVIIIAVIYFIIRSIRRRR